MTRVRVPLLSLLFILLLCAAASAQWVQQGPKLIAPEIWNSPQQGYSVAMSADGNTAIVGAYYDSLGIGGAWVFTRLAGVWTLQGSKLSGSGAVGYPHQGISVALSADGNTALVGGFADNSSAGAAWVFTRSGGVWTQQGAKLVGTFAVGAARQGRSVALSADGNIAVVGGDYHNSKAGALWIFTRSAGVWTQKGGTLEASDETGSAWMGTSVAISADGRTILAGGFADNSNVGAAWVFHGDGIWWNQEGNKLVGSGTVGAPRQGFSVALSADGSTAVIGGYGDNSSAGAAWVFTRSAGVWTQQGIKLVGTGAVGSANQGFSVDLSADGNTVLLGGPYDMSSAGAAWMFTRSGSTWTQVGSKLFGNKAEGAAMQGWSVALSSDGNTAAVGGMADNFSAGAAWIFTGPRPTISHIADVPSDQGGKVLVMWDRSGYDVFPQQTLTSYGIYRGAKVSMLPKNVDLHRFARITLDKATGETIYWEHYADVAPRWLEGYSLPVTTISDSTSHGNPRYYFMVTASSTSPVGFWQSPPDSGYSVDNIPPLSVIGAGGTSTPGGPILLSWNKDKSDPDLAGYHVYRSTVKGFTPGRGNALALVMDTTYTDNAVVTGTNYYYRIAAMDIHDNIGAPSAEIGQKAGTTTVGDGESGVPSVFALGQNYPNPFNPATEIRYTVAAPRPERMRGVEGPAIVSLRVYDVLGREVATLVNEEKPPGTYTVSWDANGMASGVYFCRLRAGEFVETKRMMLVR